MVLMIHQITIQQFLKEKTRIPLLDVRTPAEYLQGHIPGAANLPLFTNEERVAVGTTYKQQGREAAILLGFDLTGNKWSGFIRQALAISPAKEIALHCWRGGMRSGTMAWALDLYGFDVWLIEGGYKSYRRHANELFAKSYNMVIVGGMTGSGKTATLQSLAAMAQQVVDLEELAQHRGSTFGSLNRLVQPTQEQFENELAAQLRLLDETRPIFIEDESIAIGKRFIPKPFFDRMQQAPLIELQISREQRITNLLAEYGILEPEFLIACTQRIWKRLGPAQTKEAIAAINAGELEKFISIVLVYYDKTYQAGITRRPGEIKIPVTTNLSEPAEQAAKILEATKHLFLKAHEHDIT